MSSACPQCHLPREAHAWECDGCGHLFRRDFDAVRAELQAGLRRSRTVFWGTVLVDLALVGAVVALAMHGWIYVSVPLLLGIVGSIGNAAHKMSVLRGHLRALDRRHAPLPRATATRAP